MELQREPAKANLIGQYSCARFPNLEARYNWWVGCKYQIGSRTFKNRQDVIAYWQAATPEQRSAFLAQDKGLFSYAAEIGDYELVTMMWNDSPAEVRANNLIKRLCSAFARIDDAKSESETLRDKKFIFELVSPAQDQLFEFPGILLFERVCLLGQIAVAEWMWSVAAEHRGVIWLNSFDKFLSLITSKTEVGMRLAAQMLTDLEGTEFYKQAVAALNQSPLNTRISVSQGNTTYQIALNSSSSGSSVNWSSICLHYYLSADHKFPPAIAKFIAAAVPEEKLLDVCKLERSNLPMLFYLLRSYNTEKGRTFLSRFWESLSEEDRKYIHLINDHYINHQYQSPLQHQTNSPQTQVAVKSVSIQESLAATATDSKMVSSPLSSSSVLAGSDTESTEKPLHPRRESRNDSELMTAKHLPIEEVKSHSRSRLAYLTGFSSLVTGAVALTSLLYLIQPALFFAALNPPLAIAAMVTLAVATLLTIALIAATVALYRKSGTKPVDQKKDRAVDNLPSSVDFAPVHA